MITLSPGDVLTIVLTCLAAAVAVSAIAFLALRALRGRRLVLQLIVIAGAGIVGVTASVLAISVEMYLSPHDLTVLVCVLLVAAALACGMAALLARSVGRSLRELGAAARDIDSSQLSPSDDRDARRTHSGPAELQALGAELSEVRERVRAARSELEQLDSARRRFFAWISHDLRTPLAALRVTAEHAETSTVPETRALADAVNGQVTGLTRLVDDLFELSQLSSGQLRLRPETVDLSDLISDSVADMRAAAAAHDVQIVPRQLSGHTVWADPHRLTRIIVNLLSNAIRYAPAGTEILVTASRTSTGNVALAVIDLGGGVAVEHLDSMFDVGWRDDAARTAADTSESAGSPDPVASGSGLGLAIARGFARAHGGDLTAAHVAEGFALQLTLPPGERPGEHPGELAVPHEAAVATSARARPVQ